VGSVDRWRRCWSGGAGAVAAAGLLHHQEEVTAYIQYCEIIFIC